MQQTAICDVTAIKQVKVFEGQFFEVQQTAIRDLSAPRQVEVLEGQPFEVQQASVCRAAAASQRGQTGVGTQPLELITSNSCGEDHVLPPRSDRTGGRQR